MEKLSAKKRISIIRMYLSGLSHDEIATKTGISKGTVNNIVNELKAGIYPEAADLGEQVKLLRELALDLKHAGLAPGQCAVGLSVLNRVKECGLEVADIERWPDILKMAGNEHSAQEFVDRVCHILEVAEKEGISLEEVDTKLQSLEQKAAEVAPAIKKIKDCEHEIQALAKQRTELTPAVKILEQQYTLLGPRVKDLEKREKDLLERIDAREDEVENARSTLDLLHKEKQVLQTGGFSPEALVEFADRARAIAARHHIALPELRERLLKELECLDNGLTLESMVQDGQTLLETQQREIAETEEKLACIESAVVQLRQQKAVLEGDIKNVKEKVVDEVAKIAPAAEAAVNNFTGELQRGSTEVLEIICHLKDEALKIGEEIGRYQTIVETNQWISDLLSLVKGEEKVGAKQVRTIVSLLIGGIETWATRNTTEAAASNMLKSLPYLKEVLKQWTIPQ